MTVNRLHPSPNGVHGQPHGATHNPDAPSPNGDNGKPRSPAATHKPEASAKESFAGASGSSRSRKAAAKKGGDPAGNGNLAGSTAAEPDTARDAHGRFLPGNPGGPGNPYARHVAELKAMFLEEAGPERIRNIIRKLLDLAEEGNVAAIKLALSYALGKPQPAANPDQVDYDEWQRMRETHNLTSEMPMLAKAPAPELPLGLLRSFRAGATETQRAEALGLMTLPQKERAKLKDLSPSDYHAKLRAQGAKAVREIERSGRLRTLDAEYGPPSPGYEDLRNPPPDPWCNAGRVSVAGPSVAGPSPNGNKR